MDLPYTPKIGDLVNSKTFPLRVEDDENDFFISDIIYDFRPLTGPHGCIISIDGGFFIRAKSKDGKKYCHFFSGNYDERILKIDASNIGRNEQNSKTAC